MPEPATPLDPNLSPRLILRESPQAHVLASAAWGVWGRSGHQPILITNGRAGTANLRTLTGDQPGWLTIGAQDDQARSRMDWGTWGEARATQLLVTGGVTGPEETPALWRWSPGDDAFRPFGISQMRVPWWGAWGQVDGNLVLATGGQGGLVHFWDSLEFAELGAVQVNDGGLTSWGAWGQVNGEPMLATGGRLGVQLWPSRILRDFGTASSASEPALLNGPETAWGAWGEVLGDPVLATGDIAGGGVRLFNHRTRDTSTLHFGVTGDPSSSGGTWGCWRRVHDAPLLIVGDGSGEVWFCDPVTGTSRAASLTKAVSWGAWTEVGDQPMLATADEAGEVQCWDLVWERTVPRVPRYSSDTGGAVDRLGRRHDAEALADVITARSARPPLAVGVFGQWGDGKSTFLEILQEQVEERAKAAGPDDPIAHGQVRQVRFNAWHYAEADLWASLVAELFAQLGDGPGTDPAQEQRQLSRLASELVQSRGLREQLAAAQARLEDLRAASPAKVAGWDSLTPSAQLHLRATLGEDAERLYDEAVATASTSRAGWRSWSGLARALPRSTKLVVLGTALVALAVVIWGPGLLRRQDTWPESCRSARGRRPTGSDSG